MNELIHVRQISAKLDDHQVFSNLSFTVKKKKKIAIRGDSGTGKSTLLQILLGFISVQAGSIEIFGQALVPKNLSYIRQHTSWVPQEYALSNEEVAPFVFSLFAFKHNRKNMPSRSEVFKVLNAFGLEEKVMDQSFDTLSGGQKQRVLLAVCILMKRPLVLLDEPTSALDQRAVDKVIDYCFSLKDTTIVAATHDQRWIDHCDKAVDI